MIVMSDGGLNMLKKHEGLRLSVYSCSGGKLTIGYGHNITNDLIMDNVQRVDMINNGITQAQAEEMLLSDVENATRNLLRIFNQNLLLSIGGSRVDTLINMMFNLGSIRFKKFKKTIKHIRARQWDLASAEALNSRWANQVGNRATQLANILNKGEHL